MDEPSASGPESTAVRVALWRAMHARVDPPPHVLDDEIGLELAAPEVGWERRPDMDAAATSSFRASIVARARFVEDLLENEVAAGVRQYVILGAGLDTFAQRRGEIAEGLRVFEVDQPGPQAWKRRRLAETGYGVPEWLRLVPVDFESGASWLHACSAAGFDASRPAVVAATGLTMYLTKEAIAATMREVAALAPGSVLAMTFLLPVGDLEADDRSMREEVERGARSSGTPFVSSYAPTELLDMAAASGLSSAEHLPGTSLVRRYFVDAPNDALAEEFLVART